MTALVVVAFVGAYVLIATERVHRVAAALGGAAVMVLLGVVDVRTAFFSEETGVDWNVIGLLLGMMIIVGVMKPTGVFEYLAIWAAKRGHGRPFRVLVILVVVTATASALLDNVTTVLLIAPVTLLVCERLDSSPVPFLIAEAMASNIGGTATLIGDPPNIIIASRADLTFNDFLVNLAPVVVILMIVFVGLCWMLFGRTMSHDPISASAVMQLDERAEIRDSRLLMRSLCVLALVIGGFVLHSLLDIEPSLVALLGAGLLVMISRVRPEDYLAEVEWPTLVFFMGLFIMVGALVSVGVVDSLGRAATEAMDGRYLLGGTVLLWGSGIASGIIDNIPYVATMAPLVGDLADAGTSVARSLWWALALGADLGGNATAVGASANVVVIGIAARRGHPISFWRFTKYGLIVAPVTIAVSWVYLWLRYFALT